MNRKTNVPKRSSGSRIPERQSVSVFRIRLIICCGVFLVCAAFKLAFPETSAVVGGKLCTWINSDGGYVDTVEAIGESIARGDDLRQVFGEMTGLSV